MTGAAYVLRGNALALPLPDDSVDLCITSPPYFALRSYQDADGHYTGQIGSELTPTDFIDALLAATQEMVRVLKPTGSIWVNLGDKYAGSIGHNNNNAKSNASSTLTTRRKIEANAAMMSAKPRKKVSDGGVRAKSLIGLPWRYAIRCIDELGLILRAEVVWSKVNVPEPHVDRVRRSHEHWFHLVKQPRYFSSTDEIREMGRVPGSVWTIPFEPLTVPEWAMQKHGLTEHFAAFPQEWPRRIILGWSPVGGLILDPFGGTGTVAGTAKSLDRTGISLDLSHDYCKLARWRIEESMNFKKGEQRTWKERQGQFLEMLEIEESAAVK